MDTPTILMAASAVPVRVCPKCQTANAPTALEQRQYRCAGCALELAHLDLAVNGAVRGIFGWLLDPGTVVHERYQVVAVLGKGGFGVTYLVDDIRLAGKRLALKEIPSLLFDEYETRLLGRLRHPGIPYISDRFDVGAMVYLALEFGGSRTLRIEMERHGGRIPVFQLLPWMEQVCAALVYLHSQDPPIIHRDLKPENILLDDTDRVMLIDFGIAKENDEQTVTRTLGRAVTHGFSPPEQVLGTGTDVRSDVYALGAILYCAITGRIPPAAHERITGMALEPPSRFFPEIPPLLDAAICQALELNLLKRQQSIAELAQSLALVRSGGTSAQTVVADDTAALTAGVRATAAVPLAGVEFPSLRRSQVTAEAPSIREQPFLAPAPPSRRWAWVGIGLVGALAAGSAGWRYWPRSAQQPAESVPLRIETPISAAALQPGEPPAAPLLPAESAPALPGLPAGAGLDQPAVAVPGTRSPPTLVAPGQTPTVVSAPISGALVPGPSAHASGLTQTGQALLTPSSGLVPQSAAQTAAPPPPTRLPPDSLPSVFSHEQHTSVSAAATPSSTGMDEYEKQLQRQAKTVPLVTDIPSDNAVTTTPRKAKSTRSAMVAKPKTQSAVTRAPVKSTPARAPKKAQPSPSFSIRYQGAHKTD